MVKRYKPPVKTYIRKPEKVKESEPNESTHTYDGKGGNKKWIPKKVGE